MIESGILAVMANKVHAVGTIFENSKGEILVLRRHKNDPEGNTWGLAGGKIDPGESKEEAAVREIKEETGLDVDPSELKFVRSYHWDRDDLDISFGVFRLLVGELNHQFDLPENEITDFMWDTPSNLLRRDDLMLGLYDILKSQYDLN